MNILQRFLAIREYKKSLECKKLNHYIRRIRKLDPMTDEEWDNFRRLAEREKDFYSSLKRKTTH